MENLTVRIPRSAVSRSAEGFAKLLFDVEPNVYSGFAFKGRLLRPGSHIAESDLWPTPEYPRPALLVEYAGPSLKPARGHNRHAQENLWILWRYRPGAGKWEELARCCMVAETLVSHLLPIARAALAEARGPQPLIDIAAVEARIAGLLDAELRGLSPAQAERVLTVVHDQLATRICGAHLRIAA